MPSKDLRPIIADWPHESGQIKVRKIRGLDNRVKIQMRVDLGVLQMETEGRPDGERPFNHESLLEYHLARLESHKRRNGTDLGFSLSPDECLALRDESLQYYHRYLASFAMQDYDMVVRDTQRNLDVLDLCCKYAEQESDQIALEAHRPYIIMMNTRAKALGAMANGQYLTALAHAERGLVSIRDFFKKYANLKSFNHSPEVVILKALRREIRKQLPVDPIRKLKQELANAVAEERFEDAAQLRDSLEAFLKQHGEQS
ncbi:MAG: UvrB/UvrC motif-containing protein [Phycisphaerae bacterium]